MKNFVSRCFQSLHVLCIQHTDVRYMGHFIVPLGLTKKHFYNVTTLFESNGSPLWQKKFFHILNSEIPKFVQTRYVKTVNRNARVCQWPWTHCIGVAAFSVLFKLCQISARKYLVYKCHYWMCSIRYTFYSHQLMHFFHTTMYQSFKLY